jgi:putative copper export protein
MLNISGAELLLWLHVLAACVWIGGQVVIAAVVPLLRGTWGLTTAVGRRFHVVAWPAFAMLVATGIANVHNAGIEWRRLADNPTGRTLMAKLGLVAVSSVAAAAHAFVQAPRASASSRARTATSAVLGSLSLLAAAAAALLGVVIAQA